MAVNARELDDRIDAALAAYVASVDPAIAAPMHLKVMGDTMWEYFEEKIEVDYGWYAELPPPPSTPDGTTKFTSKAKFPAFELLPATDLVASLAGFIHKAFIAASIIHPGAWSVAPGKFLCPAPPPLIQVPGSKDGIYECIVVPTCTWVVTSIDNPAPCTGVHGPYVVSGHTTSMKTK